MISKNEKLDFHWKRQYSAFQGLAIAKALAKTISIETTIEGKARVEGQDNWIKMYSNQGSLVALVSSITNRIKNDLPSIEKDIEGLEKGGEKFIEFVREIKITSTISDNELLELHQKYLDLFTEYSVYLWKSFYFVEAGASIFEQVIKENLSADSLLEAVNFYSVPSAKAHVMTISEYFKQENDNQKRVEYLKNNFPWILSTDPYTLPPSNQQLLDFASSFSTKEVGDVKNKVFNLSKEAMHFVSVYQRMLYLKDKRDEYRRHAFYLGIPLIEEIMKRFSISRDDFWYILPTEVSLLQEKRLLLIKKRRVAYVFDVNTETPELAEGEEAKKYFREDKEVTDKINIIKGIVACPGKVVGVIQKVNSVEDVGKFEKGKILVAVTTNPDYVPAMQKAAAFVTDEGGITSHAAIVARELKKPCIVGTKISTKLLKDGDEVEVDANKGIVIIIK